jgi:hypothetical protein
MQLDDLLFILGRFLGDYCDSSSELRERDGALNPLWIIYIDLAFFNS